MNSLASHSVPDKRIALSYLKSNGSVLTVSPWLRQYLKREGHYKRTRGSVVGNQGSQMAQGMASLSSSELSSHHGL